MIQRIVLERITDPGKGLEKLRIVKVEGVGFPKDPDRVDNIDDRAAHFKKFEVGTVMGIYDFLSDPDYYTKMYSIVHKQDDYVTNV